MRYYAHLYSRFRQEYESGKNTYRIAEQFKTSPETVRRGIRKAGGQTFRRARKYFVDANRERQIKFNYGLTLEDMEVIWKIQKGLCLWCKAKLPRKVLLCVVDHIGGKETFGQKDKVRGLCCPNGHCNRLAGLVEAGMLSKNSLFRSFVDHVQSILRMG